MTAALVTSIPVAVVFAWLQRSLVRGLGLGTVKELSIGGRTDEAFHCGIGTLGIPASGVVG